MAIIKLSKQQWKLIGKKTGWIKKIQSMSSIRNFWTERTVNRNSDKAGFTNSQEYLNAKAKEFESNSGVKWSISPGGGGYTFHPIDEGIVIASTVADNDLNAIKYAYKTIEKDLTGYVSYLRVSETSEISLKQLIPIVKWMEKHGVARRTVDRMGKGFAFKLT